MSETGLAPAERRELEDLEGVIERGLETFVEVGNALLVIREKELFRGTHKAFEGYCRERWNFTGRRANQLIEAAGVVNELAPSPDLKTPAGVTESKIRGTMVPGATVAVPINERQAREVAKAEPGKRAEVWKEAVETAPKGKGGAPKVTAEHVRKTVEANKSKALAEVAKGTPGLADKIKPGKDPEPAAAPAEPVPTDEEGAELPDRASVRAAFAGRGKVKAVLDAFTALKGAMKELWASPAAERYGDGIRQQADADREASRSLIVQYQPHAVCPECDGKREDDCPTCGGYGYVTREGWKRVGDGLKARKNIAERNAKGGRGAA